MIVTYRVFLEENEQYTLRELFYDHDGHPIAYGKAPITPKAGSLQELNQELTLLQEALSLPVLTVTEIENAIADRPVKEDRKRKTISHAELIKRLGLEPATEQELGRVVHPA